MMVKKVFFPTLLALSVFTIFAYFPFEIIPCRRVGFYERTGVYVDTCYGFGAENFGHAFASRDPIVYFDQIVFGLLISGISFWLVFIRLNNKKVSGRG